MENTDIISNVLRELEYLDTNELNPTQQMMVARAEGLFEDLAWELQEEQATEFMSQFEGE